jgi:NAD(P)-dependent dehydrogenase (short-subunit alcohol dehydrogenase family)
MYLIERLKRMIGKICIVTGSNSGIGKETALALTGMGATVVMAVRDLERGETAREEIIICGGLLKQIRPIGRSD